MNTPFWTQKEYNTFFQSKKDKNSVLQSDQRHLSREGTRLVESNENVATDCLETEDGDIVDGTTA